MFRTYNVRFQVTIADGLLSPLGATDYVISRVRSMVVDTIHREYLTPVVQFSPFSVAVEVEGTEYSVTFQVTVDEGLVYTEVPISERIDMIVAEMVHRELRLTAPAGVTFDPATIIVSPVVAASRPPAPVVTTPRLMVKSTTNKRGWLTRVFSRKG